MVTLVICKKKYEPSHTEENVTNNALDEKAVIPPELMDDEECTLCPVYVADPPGAEEKVPTISPHHEEKLTEEAGGTPKPIAVNAKARPHCAWKKPHPSTNEGRPRTRTETTSPRKSRNGGK